MPDRSWIVETRMTLRDPWLFFARRPSRGGARLAAKIAQAGGYRTRVMPSPATGHQPPATVVKMPPPPLAPNQVEVKLSLGTGSKRYVLNVPEPEITPVSPPPERP